MVDRWPLVVADFHRLLGIDLEATYAERSWAWFEIRVRAIVSMRESLFGLSLEDPQPAPEPPRPPTIGEGLAA